MAKKNPDNPGSFVTQTECLAHIEHILDRVDSNYTELKGVVGRIDKAMWGEEGRGGMVKDVNDVKRTTRLAGALTAVVVGMLSSIMTALIVQALQAL